MDQEQSLSARVRALLGGQSLGVLSTHSADGHPYASLVGFAASDDLRRLFFATGRQTRKYANLEADARAAMLVDDRRGDRRDFSAAIAATALGRVVELPDGERAEAVALYLTKLPFLDDFVSSPSCALLCLEVERYLVVSRFQHVLELQLEP